MFIKPLSIYIIKIYQYEKMKPKNVNRPIQRIAFCDFDGTLSKGYISMDFLDYVYAQKVYSKQSYEEQIRLYSRVKNKEISYERWCDKWGEVWAAGLKNQPYNLINKHAQEFFQQFKQNIYDSSYQLIKELKKAGYYVIAASVGAYEVVSLAASALGMDECFATKLEFKDGVCTGNLATNIHVPGGKEKALDKIVKEKNVSFENCMALGDSASDMEMFELVKTPIALNPTPELLGIIKQKKIPYLNHKNVLKGIKKFLQ